MDYRKANKVSYNSFWYPLTTGYRMFSSYWWKDVLDLSRYPRFFKIKWRRLNGLHVGSDWWEYGYSNALRQYEIFNDFKEHHCGHLPNLCPFCNEYPESIFDSKVNEACTCREEFIKILDKIILAWESRLKILNDFEYSSEYYVDGKYNHEAYLAWAEPLNKAWKEGMALYIEHYDGFWD